MIKPLEILRAGWVYQCSQRKYNRKVNRMKRKFKKGALSSNTTQNVAGGVLAGGGSAYGAVKAGRVMFGDSLPWDASMDEQVAGLVSVVLVPIASRALSGLRHWFKEWRGAS